MYRYYLATDEMIGRRAILNASEALLGVVEIYGVHSWEWRPLPDFDTFHDAVVVDESTAMGAIRVCVERARLGGGERTKELLGDKLDTRLDPFPRDKPEEWPRDLPDLEPPSKRGPRVFDVHYQGDYDWSQLSEARKLDVLLRDPAWARREDLNADPDGDRLFAVVRDRIREMDEDEALGRLLKMPSQEHQNEWLRMEPRLRRARLMLLAEQRRAELSEEETLTLLIPMLRWQREYWLDDLPSDDQIRLLKRASERALALSDDAKIQILVAFSEWMDRYWWLADEPAGERDRLLALVDERLREQGLLR